MIRPVAVWAVPTLQWPLDGLKSSRSISMSFGANWSFGECPTGTDKRHTGMDVSAAAGEDVHAAYGGTVKAISNYDPTWHYGLVIDHGSFTTTYWHIEPTVSVGAVVAKGAKIGDVANLGTNTHFPLRGQGCCLHRVRNQGRTAAYQLRR